MKKIKATGYPTVEIKKILSGNDDEPSIQYYQVDIIGDDFDASEFGAPDGLAIATAKLIVLAPAMGNVTDEADAVSQEIYDVATAFYGPDGQTPSRRADKAGASLTLSGIAAPLAYLDQIHLLRGYEATGQAEAGLAIALAEIASWHGLDAESGEMLMAAAHKKATCFLCDGPDLSGGSPIETPKSIQSALGLRSWVKEGESFQTESGHASSSGLGAVAQEMMGYGQTLVGNELLGTASFDPRFSIAPIERSDAFLERFASERQLACAAAMEKKDREALAEALARISERLADGSSSDPDADRKALSLASGAFPSEPMDVASRLREQRGKSPAAEKPLPSSSL